MYEACLFVLIKSVYICDSGMNWFNQGCVCLFYFLSPKWSVKVLLCCLWEMCTSHVVSIAGSGCRIIMVSFIKLWIGTLWGLLTSFWFCVPKHYEDVLISLGPNVELNLLSFDLQKKERKVTLTASALFVFLLVSALLNLSWRTNQSHIYSN